MLGLRGVLLFGIVWGWVDGRVGDVGWREKIKGGGGEIFNMGRVTEMVNEM